MILRLTAENHGQIEQSPKPVVIDVFATWCGPCMDMKPIFETIAADLGDKYTFAMLNVDESRELAIRYEITSIPTLLFLKDGKVRGKEVGFMSNEDIREKIKEHCG